MDSLQPMILMPIVCAILSAMCAAVLLRDARSRPRPDKIVWSIAFTMFAVAAGADAAGNALGWNTWLAKLYYFTGPALVVAFLAIGQLYLLMPAAMRRFGPGATLLVTALWLSLVENAPVDSTRLAADGWDAIERGPEMVAITILINSVGTMIIVGGAGWSAVQFWRRGTHRNRMVGCALICMGTLIVAAGGSLSRLGYYEYLYVAMAIGIAMIFGGVLMSRRPEGTNRNVFAMANATHFVASTTSAEVPSGMPGSVGGLAFVEELLLTRADPEIDAICTEWSVPRETTASLTRLEARRAWKLRALLSPEALKAFDVQPVGSRRQLGSLYHDVLTWERPAREDIAEVVVPAESLGVARHA
ncbi:hypothetical protein BH20CHL3_BH20CHL3_03950 [soil metagenome]